MDSRFPPKGTSTTRVLHHKGATYFIGSPSSKGRLLEAARENDRYLVSLLRGVSFPALAALILLISFTAVANAQKSLPGDTLYPIKRLSENVAVAVNPKFKEEILQRNGYLTLHR